MTKNDFYLEHQNNAYTCSCRYKKTKNCDSKEHHCVCECFCSCEKSVCTCVHTCHCLCDYCATDIPTTIAELEALQYKIFESNRR